ncbi:MAG: SGNH/GDSL hydrolase family protein [Bacilli bacterium]|nr:SGNH/GDSL hydrolase family protein [Bacilli bacterium]
MKIKIILILLLFTILLIFSYSSMNKKVINYTIMGDKDLFSNNIKSKNFSDLIYEELSKQTDFGNYNQDFVKDDIRIIDIINQIKDNERINNQNIQKLLKNTNILLLHIGNNEIKYKLSKYDINENNDKEIYLYLDQIINDYKELIKLLKNYDNNHIIILSNYNNTNIIENNKYYMYINDNINKLCKENNIQFINLFDILNKNNDNITNTNPTYITNKGNLALFNKIYSKIDKLYLHKTI